MQCLVPVVVGGVLCVILVGVDCVGEKGVGEGIGFLLVNRFFFLRFAQLDAILVLAFGSLL